jgi:UDP-2,3-diacylglucosamine hydrolase
MTEAARVGAMAAAEGAAPSDTIVAPAHWQSVDLLSDLHLCPALPRTFEAFARHLLHTTADAVLLLGDLFEVWIGDEQRMQPFEASCLEVIAQAARKRWVGLMVGNRDFLIGDAALAAAGAHSLSDPTLLQAFGERWLLSHGDALCLGDQAYQTFRREVRSPAWQQAFLARSLSERAALAGRIRAESQALKSARPDPGDWADVDTGAALQWLRHAQTPVLVHGHTHRPGRVELGEGLHREVLSDWDLDGPAPRSEVLRLSVAGVQRLAPAGT